MNLTTSIRAMHDVALESRAFHALGLPMLWYFNFHYRGRWHDRRALEAPEEIVELRYRNRDLKFSLTPTYAGAMKGIFLDDEYALSELLPEPPKRILDLGANIGMAAAALAAQFPAAEFVLVEPDPRNVARLARTIEWNGLTGKIVPSAVGAQSGRLRLRMGSNPTCSALETSKMHDLSGTTDVEVCTVDEILRRAGWDGADLVKIDIEGTEQELLTENNAWLARVGTLILEIHPSCSADAIAEALAEYGFKLHRHGSGREPVYIAERAGRTTP
jgi:FkbM family methyltransferase